MPPERGWRSVAGGGNLEVRVDWAVRRRREQVAVVRPAETLLLLQAAGWRLLAAAACCSLMTQRWRVVVG